MGNVIFSNSFVQVADAQITARSEATGYDKFNVMDRWHLKRRYRADDGSSSDTNYLIKFEMDIGQSLMAIFLNDVNFDKVRIRGHATDLGTDWSTASFDSGNISISIDNAINRYKAYIPLSSYAYKWLAIQVPAAATAVGSYQTKWELGTVCLMSSVTELTSNIGYGYVRSSSIPYSQTLAAGGGIERICLNPNLKWNGTIDLDIRVLSEESEMWTLNQMSITGELLFYENQGSTQNAYLCARNTKYKGDRFSYNLTRGNKIDLVELV